MSEPTTEQERLLVEAAVRIKAVMKVSGVTRKQLAKRLGLTKGRITQYLCGERNLTLRTLADIFTALGSEVHIVPNTPPPPDEGIIED